MEFYEQGRKNGDFETGIRLALQSILVSPRFLFRLEQAPADAAEDRVGDLSHQRSGSRVAAVVLPLGHRVPTRSCEGRERRVAPHAGRAREAGAAHARRSGGPRRCRRASRAQWLRLQDLEKIIPDYLLYPQYDDTLAQAMKRETELFFDSIVREDRSVLDLLTADYTFVNERLAKHYGIPNVTGSAFRRVHAARLPPRPARPGQHPDADVGRRSHLAGAARQVGDGSAARHAAAAAAAERAGARRLGQGQRGRQDAVDARAHGRAPQEPDVQRRATA